MRIKSLFFGVSNAKQNTAACISYTDAAIRSDSTDLRHHEFCLCILVHEKEF